jgi:hypothetical protein
MSRAQGRSSSGQATSRHRRSQHRALGYQQKEAASRQHQLLSTCMKLKNLCINGKFKTMPHTSIMEQLQNKPDRLRKQGRLQDQDLEEIIKEIKEGDKLNAGDGNDRAEKVAKDKHRRVLEAVKEGLLQVHGTAPNMKQQGIFRTMGENCYGLNNRIGSNGKNCKGIRHQGGPRGQLSHVLRASNQL